MSALLALVITQLLPFLSLSLFFSFFLFFARATLVSPLCEALKKGSEPLLVTHQPCPVSDYLNLRVLERDLPSLRLCCVRNMFFMEAFLFYVSLESRLAFLFGCSVLEFIFVGVSE